MSRLDRLALLLSLSVVIVAGWVSTRYFERLPHLEDEMAYTWQAAAISGGHITVPSPECGRCFLYPFVVDYNGLRFGKYPLGWPVVLAAGVKVGLRWLVNPLLAGFCIWLLYRLGKKVAGEGTGLLAAFLAAGSPFFLLNAGSLLAHIWTLFLTLGLTLAWLDSFVHNTPFPHWLTDLVVVFCLAGLALTRPLTAVGVALPFILHALILLIRGSRHVRWRLLGIAALAGLLSSLHLLWQFALTGDPFLNPYTLWWPYDRIGFGPGVGLQQGGYRLIHGLYNMRFSLSVGASDLFGWYRFSYLFLPFGLIALRRSRPAWLLAALPLTLIGIYLLYWIGSWTFGPRYYFEAIIAASLFSAAGIRWLAGKLVPGTEKVRSRIRFAAVSFVFLLGLGVNFYLYLPIRLGGMYGLYGVSASHLAPFKSQSALELTPALIIVHPQHDWIEYGTLLDLSSPYMDTPFVFTRSRTPEENARVIAMFPGRNVFHYYPQWPYEFYTAPLPEIEVTPPVPTP